MARALKSQHLEGPYPVACIRQSEVALTVRLVAFPADCSAFQAILRRFGRGSSESLFRILALDDHGNDRPIDDRFTTDVSMRPREDTRVCATTIGPCIFPTRRCRVIRVLHCPTALPCMQQVPSQCLEASQPTRLDRQTCLRIGSPLTSGTCATPNGHCEPRDEFLRSGLKLTR